ncbi:MAG TPA: peptidylprolyl isomerase [Candidatus Dormibacteraeota bacterium]|nr:peptidylprolyl isomerase [Candidatus Dormibacteraeota bacterium]
MSARWLRWGGSAIAVLVVAAVGVTAYFVNVGTQREVPAVSQSNCESASFGEPLGPLDQPANVHHYSRVPALTINDQRLYEATITVPEGKIVVCLVPGWAPITVNTFVTLVRNHFFDGLRWARDPSTPPGGPVIQGGSPTNNMSGGPGFQFKSEAVNSPLYKGGAYPVGAVAMANAGPNTNGSQFFVTLSSFTLPPDYNLFGEVVSGLDVALKVKKGDPMEITVREQIP